VAAVCSEADDAASLGSPVEDGDLGGQREGVARPRYFCAML
jgi:hypothetical protein